jgi:Zn-dependent protease
LAVRFRHVSAKGLGDYNVVLRPDVQVAQRANHTILFRARFGAVRVTRTADMLLSLLRRGAQRSELDRAVQTSHPEDLEVTQKLDQFLTRLEKAGLLESCKAVSAPPQLWPRWEFFDVNPIAARLATALEAVPRTLRRVIMGILIASSLVGIITVLDLPSRPTFESLANTASIWGIAFFVLIVVPIHELAHAVACRAAGVPVVGAGLLLHGGIVPGPFVDTSTIYAVLDRWQRFRVPIAGPLIDLYASGAFAWLLRLNSPASPLHMPLTSAMILSTVFFLLDTNPFFPTDGSRALEAVLDDELARRAAFSRDAVSLSTRRVVWTYRLSSAVYLCIVALLAGVLWQGSK